MQTKYKLHLPVIYKCMIIYWTPLKIYNLQKCGLARAKNIATGAEFTHFLYHCLVKKTQKKPNQKISEDFMQLALTDRWGLNGRSVAYIGSNGSCSKFPQEDWNAVPQEIYRHSFNMGLLCIYYCIYEYHSPRFNEETFVLRQTVSPTLMIIHLDLISYSWKGK